VAGFSTAVFGVLGLNSLTLCVPYAGGRVFAPAVCWATKESAVISADGGTRGVGHSFLPPTPTPTPPGFSWSSCHALCGFAPCLCDCHHFWSVPFFLLVDRSLQILGEQPVQKRAYVPMSGTS